MHRRGPMAHGQALTVVLTSRTDHDHALPWMPTPRTKTDRPGPLQIHSETIEVLASLNACFMEVSCTLNMVPHKQNCWLDRVIKWRSFIRWERSFISIKLLWLGYLVLVTVSWNYVLLCVCDASGGHPRSDPLACRLLHPRRDDRARSWRPMWAPRATWAGRTTRRPRPSPSGIHPSIHRAAKHSVMSCTTRAEAGGRTRPFPPIQ